MPKKQAREHICIYCIRDRKEDMKSSTSYKIVSATHSKRNKDVGITPKITGTWNQKCKELKIC